MKKRFSLFIILFCALFIHFSEMNFKIDAMTNNESSISEYTMYSFENVDNFKNYLKDSGYDLYNTKDVALLAKKFDELYVNAIKKGIIKKINNDILLLRDDRLNINNVNIIKDDEGNTLGITPMWSAGQTLEDGNNGTHQVITRDALFAVTPMYPNFFLRNSKGFFITQTYSDYPDIEETAYGNSWHFYNFLTKANYWWNILDSNTAKSKFLEHYNNAKTYYNTNPTQAFRELGAAMHYISDIASPVHTGDGLSPDNDYVYLLPILGTGLILALYLADMGLNHATFENYVNDRDENTYCAIPSNINYDYYVNVSLDSLVESVASNSYNNYDRARGTSSEMYQAMINTLPKTKEVVAGLLYRFAIEMNVPHTHTYTYRFTGNDYHSGNQHYFQYSKICSICGYNAPSEWRTSFCPGPPCFTPM